jgi:hypothetical protein
MKTQARRAGPPLAIAPLVIAMLISPRRPGAACPQPKLTLGFGFSQLGVEIHRASPDGGESIDRGGGEILLGGLGGGGDQSPPCRH